ncbi:MAG: GIY-YIG nuclease family protein [Candidatus Omnitrophica bacterium]|nr:GIY-YIG nuclease family protein [Candidatus Omnitrophota bacterium]
MDYYVYVLKSMKNNRFYTGSTQNLEKRLMEHQTGQSKATRYVRPFKLLFFETYPTRSEAVRREKALKTGKGREEVLLKTSGL